MGFNKFAWSIHCQQRTCSSVQLKIHFRSWLCNIFITITGVMIYYDMDYTILLLLSVLKIMCFIVVTIMCSLRGEICTHRTEVIPVTTLFFLPMPTLVHNRVKRTCKHPIFSIVFWKNQCKLHLLPPSEDATTQWINHVCDGNVATTTRKLLQVVTN